MRLLDIECVNFRTLAKFFHTFKAGITGLVGHNGTGKSSLLSAICYGLTGTVLGDDIKKELLRWGTTKGYVKIRFEEQRKIYVIKRNIQGSAVDLREEGATKALFASKEDIDSFMTSLIGLHPRLYNKVIFIEQEHLDDVCMATHSKRVDFFNDLFDASVTEKLRDLIQTYIQSIPVFPDYAEEKIRLYGDSAEKRKQATAMTTDINKMETALAELPSDETLAAWAVKPRQTTIDFNIRSHKAVLVRLKGEIQQFKDTVMPAFITADRAMQHTKYLTMKSMEKTVEETKLAYEGAVMPELKDFMGSDPQKCLDDTNAAQLNLTEKLRLCELGKCPTCGNEYKDAPREDLIKQQKDNERIILETQNYLRAKSAYDQIERRILEREEDLQKYIKTLSKDDLAFDEEAYNKDEALIQSQKIRIEDYRQLEFTAAEAEKKIPETEAAITQLKDTEGITDKDQEHYSTLSETAKEVREGKHQLEITREGLTTAVSMNDTRIQTILQGEKQNEKYVEYKAILTRVREVLHRECLPQIRVAAGLVLINVKLMEWLDLFDVSFTAKINGDCDFEITKEGYSELAFKSLSVGQRKVTAVAFRLAVAEIFGSALGVLALDEPTAYMDEDAKENLIEVLIKAEARARATNMNVFIPTHETLLMTAFTDSVDMVGNAA